MKINKVILSSDSNPLYLDFWPLVSKIWIEKFNIKPILLYVDENHDIDVSKEYGDVFKFKPVKNVPIYLQVLWIRYWIFSKFQEEILMISDIDMIPLSKKYFIDNISNIEDEKYVHLNPCIDSYGTLPSCYHICNGKLFSEILELEKSWEESIINLMRLNIGTKILGTKDHWFADERYSSKKILEYKERFPNKIIFMDREGGQNGRRIDRINWNYSLDLLKQNYYFDCHSIRPYGAYKNQIDNLVNLL